VHGAIGEGTAGKGKLFEGALGLGGLTGGAKGKGAKPLPRIALRLRWSQLERLRAAAGGKLREGLLQGAGGEVIRELAVAISGTPDQLLFEVVLAGVAHVRARGRAAHEEGRKEEYWGSQAHGT
jgi:hypothetical protein